MDTPDNESPTTETAELDAFISRWQASGAAERANCQLFLSELCYVLADVGGPQDPTRLAARFKGVRKATVAEILETLAALGNAHELGDSRYAV